MQNLLASGDLDEAGFPTNSGRQREDRSTTRMKWRQLEGTPPRECSGEILPFPRAGRAPPHIAVL
jgi:hypothetical protein